ncbi:MAG: hypothetical protein KDC44_03980, partial [Phaeodactylibacter sp.]|nr:hypothetical protein [Phaeodactylibacter sp.]
APEMLKPDTYSIENYREADRMVAAWNDLLEQSTNVYQQLPESHLSAYYQLVQSPIELCANLNEMYVAAGKNKYYADRGAAAANFYADKVKKLFDRDAELTQRYHELEAGKWNHMMSQTHIGYTYWNHPPMNTMPAVRYVETKHPAELGYLLEYGEAPRWGWLDVEADWSFSHNMPVFDPINDQDYYIEVFNKGEQLLSYGIEAKDKWIQLSKPAGTIQYEEKVYASIDWNQAPKGAVTGEIKISGAGKEYLIKVPIQNTPFEAKGFVENNGVVSIEAANYTHKYDGVECHWTVIPNLGRTQAAITPEPMNMDRQALGENTARVEYEFTVLEDGDLKIETYLSPTQNFLKGDGLHFAIAIDDEEPHLININEGEIEPDWAYAQWWMKSVGDHIKKSVSEYPNIKAGSHILKVWTIDPGVVIQKFVIDAGGLKPSYLGPPESRVIDE